MLTQKQTEQLKRYFNNDDFEDKDALAIYPFRYETREVKNEGDWQIGEEVLFEAVIISPIRRFRKSARQVWSRFDVQTEHQIYHCLSFNPYLQKSFEGQKVSIIAKLSKSKELIVNSVSKKPIHELVGIFPVYPLKGDLKQYQMRRIMTKVVKENIQSVKERVPSVFRERYKLYPTKDSVKQLHLPSSQKALEYSLRTLKYTEFLDYQTALQIQKKTIQHEHKPPKKISNETLQSYLSHLPFNLSDEQLKVLDEIKQDMASSVTMTRLLQGDVGTGKTVISVLASVIAVNSGYQVAILCPTEVLMTQHVETFQSFLNQKFQIVSLSSSLKSNEKSEVLDFIESGTADIIIGTHSLFSETTIFNNLGLVVIDEQHRFGVNQRQALISKGRWVDVLMMSATPIPRTLASALYAHLDVSTIESSSHRKSNVETILLKQNSMIPIMDTILERISRGDQCYVVCPAIEESTMQTRNVKEIYEQLSKYYGEQISISLIHGQMDSEIITQTLTDFRNRKIDLLVTTTVIEVGIHVATANTMVIYDADRFGLAQIHQLRGRIGRDMIQGLCYLLTKSSDRESLQRLEYLNETSDGFQLAYYDLKMRGSGDLLGQRQSGIPSFLLSDIVADEKILVQAKEDAQWLIEQEDDESLAYVSSIKEQMEHILLQSAI